MKLLNNVLIAITQCHPMNNFMCKPSRERERVNMEHINI